MDALLLALLLTLILDQGSGTQQAVARLGDAGTMSSGRIAALLLTIAVNAAIAALLGEVMAALLMPDARLLFLAIALLIGGGGLIIAPFRRPAPANAAPRSPLRTLSGLALRRAGENAAFATAGVVAFTDAPVLAAIGATLGGWAALGPPLALGSRYSRHGLLRLLQLLAGGILLCIAIACAVNALRIV